MGNSLTSQLARGWAAHSCMKPVAAFTVWLLLQRTWMGKGAVWQGMGTNTPSHSTTAVRHWPLLPWCMWFVKRELVGWVGLFFILSLSLSLPLSLKHVLNLMCVRMCMCLPQTKLIFIYTCIYFIYFLCSLSTCFSVYWCPFQHGLYEYTYTYSTYCSSLYP